MRTIGRIALSLIIFFAVVVTASAQNAINQTKVSKHLIEIAQDNNVKSTRNVNALVSLTVQCDAKSFFNRYGCRLIDSIGRIYIVNIPLNAVAELSHNDTIQRLEAERMPKARQNN